MEKVLAVERLRRGRLVVTLSSGRYVVPDASSVEVADSVDPEYLSRLQADCCKSDVESYLAYSERSSGQLMRKVLSLGYSASVAEDAVRWAEKYGFVDDRRFSRSFLASKTLGRKRLKAELLSRGVAESIAEETVSGLSDSDAIEELVDLIRKKYGGIENRQTAKRRAANWLLRRGFTGEVVYKVLEKAL